MPTVRIPVAAGVTPPRICMRHGRPARTATPMVFQSRPPVWVVLVMFLAGWLVYHFVGAKVRRQVSVPAWPWCGRCDLIRWGRVTAGAALLLAGLLTAVSMGDAVRGTAALLTLAGTVAVMTAGVVALTRGTRAAVSGVHVSRDGAWLELRNPHQRFTDALRERPAPAYPMPAGWTVPVTAAPSAVWAAVDPAPVQAAAPPGPPAPTAAAPAHGWTPPNR